LVTVAFVSLALSFIVLRVILFVAIRSPLRGVVGTIGLASFLISFIISVRLALSMWILRLAP